MSTSVKDRDKESVKWTMRAHGLRRFPHRFIFNIADYSRLLWWSAFTALPAVLLAVAVFVGGEFVYFHTMFSAVLIMAMWQSSERFANTTVEFDPDAGELTAIWHASSPTLFTGASGEELTVSFEDVGSARFLSLAGYTMVRLYYEKSFQKGTAFLIPSDKKYLFRESLRQHGASVEQKTPKNSDVWVWGRCAVTSFLLGVGPVSAIFIWPVQYSWAVVLVLILHFVMLLRQGL